MTQINYWQRLRRDRLSRRAMLGASARAGVGAAGLALVGCGDDDDDGAVAEAQPDDEGAQAQQADAQAQAADQTQAQAEADADEEQAVAQSMPGFTPGGTLRIAGPIDTWDYMDPHRAVFGPTQFAMGLYMNYLIRWANKEKGILEPDIGSLPEIPDPETYVFSVDQGARFWDRFPTEGGRTVTAEDVRWNFERQIAGVDANGEEDGTFLQSTKYRLTNTIDVIDEQTIAVTTDGPDATYLTSVHASPFAWITSPEAAEAWGDRWRDESTNGELTSGTGPFIPDSFSPDTVLTMNANPNFWKSGEFGPLPYFTDYETTRIVDSTAVEAAYRSKQIDFGYFPLSKLQVDGIKEDFPDHITDQMAFGFTIQLRFNYNPDFPGGNQWADRRVPFAFHQATDRYLHIDAVYLGDARVSAIAQAPWFNQAWTIPQEELVTWPGYRSNREQEVQEARALLDAAGVEPGQTFSWIAPDVWEGTYPGIIETQTALYEQALGITMDIDIQPYTVILARLQDGTHPGQTPAWTNPPSDLDPTNEWLQTHVPGASANLSQYDYQPVTDIVQEMKVTLDESERKTMAREVLEILLGVHPDHSLEGFTGQPAVMNGIQRAIRWPYVHVSDDWFQFAHNSHLFDTTWLDQNHPDTPT